MRSRILIVVALLFPHIVCAGDGGVILSGVVRDTLGVPLREILIHATADGHATIDTRTGASGAFEIDIPDASGPWTIRIDDRELLEYGYFCVPGFVWNPDQPPVIGVLETVALRPSLTMERSDAGMNCVRVSFDWLPGILPNTLRQYRIEHSLDMTSWREIVTLALACPPIEIIDETRSGDSGGYYRAVMVEPIFVVDLEPGDFEFIADPAMNPDWEGPAVLVFLADEPLPDTPVIAPEIHIREGGE